MVTGASSLGVVRNELFATMEETQQHLEHFLEERDSGTLLQSSVSNLHQIKGTLALVGLPGAEMLAGEMHSLAMDIPAGADNQHDDELAAISNGLHVLRSYLEQLEANWIEMPELMLPAINQLRLAGGQSRLPESYFFSARLNIERPRPPQVQTVDDPRAVMGHLRHLYQKALLSVIKDHQTASALSLMQRIMLQLDGLDPNAGQTTLYWIAAAAFESVIDGKLVINAERKLLFSRLDREIKQFQHNPAVAPPRGVIKDMLYLVALAHTQGPCASEVRDAANLASLPFTDRMLIDEYQRLSGPGANVFRSLSVAIQEELVTIKDTLDLIGRNAVSAEAFENLPFVITKLEKILQMVGLTGAAMSLRRQQQVLTGWSSPESVSPDELLRMADSIIYIEGLVASMELGHRHAARVSELSEDEVFAQHQLAEAQIVIREEAKSSLVLARRAITSYFEAGGESIHLENLPASLVTVRGGLWFTEEYRAAQLVQLCCDYILECMINGASMPDEKALETLAEALTGIEYYLEGGGRMQRQGGEELLEGVTANLKALGVKVSDEL